jgi:hypothetical protein
MYVLCVDKTVRCLLISNLGPASTRAKAHVTPCYNGEFVLESVLSLLAAIRVFFRSRSDTALEVLALRQQVAVLKRKRPRPHLNSLDRLF